MRLGVLIILAIVILGGLFYFFSPKPEVRQTESELSVTAIPSKAEASDELASLVIRENALFSGDKVIKLSEGDSLIITVTSDADDELHIHGYDRVVPLEKGIPTQVSLTATLTGRFPIELHTTETEIAVLEVQPK